MNIRDDKGVVCAIHCMSTLQECFYLVRHLNIWLFLLQCDCDIQGRGLAHGAQHLLGMQSEDDVLAEMRRTANNMKGLAQLLAPVLQERNLTYEAFMQTFDSEMGWTEDGTFCLLLAFCLIIHVAIMTPTGTWCTTQSGSGRYAAAVFLQCLNEHGEVVFVPVIPCQSDAVAMEGDLVPVMSVKVAFVREALSHKMDPGANTDQFFEGFAQQYAEHFDSPHAMLIVSSQVV